ncbi:glutathione S-transferase family protein [Oceanibacterium hippocampi]|uniref:Putative GST-like protein YibF n=1 Tax=Oceanibacterium hippocampi TaxID=745714 RepID=A0A1Y5TAU9_9PROT|nr:glutathione S-transferase N-terminal domain-containing protein [Oceanibacterium hippocampi]SLN59638.1 putative GST-like protein YibF [Oceanibacterium hippocampi]
MKLRHSPISPYSRKVRIVAAELGLAGRIDLVDHDTSRPGTGEAPENPLGKIPTLTLDDGEVLVDSPVLCDYLEEIADRRLTATSGPARRRALRLQAIADGICDAALLRRFETMRPEAQRSAAFDARQKYAMTTSLDWLEAHAGDHEAAFDVGAISVVSALGYVGFRFAHEPWADGRPKLAAWYETVLSRPSVRDTAPA